MMNLGTSKPLPVVPADETSPRSLLFRDEDEDADEKEDWVKCSEGQTVRRGSAPRGRLDGVKWGERSEGVKVVETREWDGEKKGVQVDGRW